MKYHTAKELQGHIIRIECLGNIPVGKKVQVTDLETGESVLNVEYIHILPIESYGAIMAQLSLGFVGKMEEQPDGSLQAQTWSEPLTVKSPEIDLTAFVEAEQPGQAPQQGGKQ